MKVLKDVKTKVLFGLTIASIAFIWIHSMMPASLSSDESWWVLELIRPILELFVGKGNVTIHLVRKLAHFTEYFILGVELCLLFNWINHEVFDKKRYLRWATPLAIGLCVASLDETIQIFADGRGPAISDVFLDFSGVCTGVLILSTFSRFYQIQIAGTSECK